MRIAAILMLTASPLAAQEFYGSGTLGFGQSQMAGAPVAIQGTDGNLNIGRGDLSFGTVFGNGVYLQGDLGFGLTDNGNSAPNTYNNSRSLVLHAGRDSEVFSYGIFAGAVASDHDNDATDSASRLLAGLEGGLDIGSRWSLDGHLGYLAGTSGSDSVATVTDGVFAGLGVGFAVTDRLRLGTSIGYINGQMDAPSTVVEAWRLQMRVDYDIARVPGLSAFGAIEYGEYHQKENVGPDDVTDVTSIVAGLTYRFGGAATPKTARLDYLGAFLANTGGVLE